MTWEPLTPKRNDALHPVTMACSLGGARLPPLITITLRFALLPPIPFLTDRGTCDVFFGRDEHAGLLRLSAGDTSVFFTPGKKTSASGSLRIRAPDGVQTGRHAPEPVEFTTGADFVEIKLPAWATPPKKRAAEPARYVGVSERVPDPAASLRGARP